jgi:uncharacterized membrane protein
MKELLFRLKSPVVITNIVAAIVAILINLGIVETGETITTIVNLVVGVLIAAGVLNNPADRENW